MSWSAPIRLSIVAIAIFGLAAYLLPSTKVSAGIANHVVISEIQVSGDVASDEFIELYNPTSQAVDITGWLLYRKNSGGVISNIVTSMSGSIPAYGYYLVAHDNYNGTIPRDTGYSNSSNTLTDDNGVFLKDGADNLIDMVGMGSSTDAELFGTLIPIAGESVERKALPNSTSTTMDTNGIHALLGNGEDTNNNGSDFTSRNIPQPQNSSSPIENPNIAQPTPTITPTAAPTVAPSPTTVQPSPTGIAPSATPVPQVSPTNAPSPTVAPSPTTAPSPTSVPSVSPSPNVTSAPTAAPTAIPSPTSVQPSPTGIAPSATPVPQVSPTNAPSPTVAPSPTPTPSGEVVMMDNQFMTCKKTYRSISILTLTFRMPSFSCLSK